MPLKRDQKEIDKEASDALAEGKVSWFDQKVKKRDSYREFILKAWVCHQCEGQDVEIDLYVPTLDGQGNTVETLIGRATYPHEVLKYWKRLVVD